MQRNGGIVQRGIWIFCFKMGGTRTSLYNDRNSPVEKGRMKRIIEMKSLNRVGKKGVWTSGGVGFSGAGTTVPS